ncbi:MAG TPA: hypothetical protein DHW14_01685 [Clostridiales bacterium]|nr:hypothetical protein [Clostridiales bacterium]
MPRNVFWGAVLLLVGFLLLASNLGYIARFSIWGLWPLLVIWPALKFAAGQAFVTVGRDTATKRIRVGGSLGVRLVALWFLAGATAQLLSNLSLSPYDWGDVAHWTLPLLLVGLGLTILLRPRRRRWEWEQTSEAAIHGGISSLIGDVRFGARPWVFKSPMRINLWVGDIDLDLTTARFQPGDNYLVIRAWAGDIDLRVPKDMEVVAEVRCMTGEARVFEEHRSGTGIDLAARRPALGGDGTEAGGSRLFIGIDITFGEIRVR